ncbi:MAG: alcohol dehydrogenase, partial [Haloferacaceae archaeon]
GVVPLPTDVMVRKEIEFVGSHGMQPTRYDELLGMVTRDRLHPDRIVSRTVPLDDLNDRLAAMTDYETEGIEVITEF